MKKATSDFGKGFVYNLLLFAKHFNNDMADSICQRYFVMQKTEQERELILSTNPDPSHNYGWNKDVRWWYEKIVPIYGSAEKALSNDIVLWANGASDHLYEIVIPRKLKTKEIGRRIKKLQDIGLAIGHGFREKTWTMKDFNLLQRETLSIAMELDRFLGIESVDATYN